MFNNSGHCAHIRPIIGCKGNGYRTGSQSIGRNGATMYGFALYTLLEWLVLRRLAIVDETKIGISKSLIEVVRADLRIWLLGNPKDTFSDDIINRRTPLATTLTPNAATQVRNGWIMQNFAFLCITDAWNSRYGFGGQRHSRPLAATSCHLIANPLLQANNGFTLQAKRIINAKISRRNERSNYLERKV